MGKTKAQASPLPLIETMTADYLAGEPSSVRISDIVESTTNPRRSFGDLDGLAVSIRSRGVLVPIIVRPIEKPLLGTQPYELVAGARRLRAACAAGLEEIPAIVRNLSAEDARDVQLIENAQREDISPLEEAEAYRALMERVTAVDKAGVIASRVGKTRAHVLRRLSLLDLSQKAKNALAGGRLMLETAYLIARIPNEKVRELAAAAVTAEVEKTIEVEVDGLLESVDTVETISHAAAKALIEQRFMLRLADAPFDRSDATLIPLAGACGPCFKRTGNQRELFGDVKGDEICLDPECFEAKVEGAWAKQAEEAQAKGASVLTIEASKNVFTFPGNPDLISTQSGYIDPDAEFRDGMSIRQYLGPGPDFHVVVARDPNGRPRELWLEREVMAEVKRLDKLKEREIAKTTVKDLIGSAPKRPPASTEKAKQNDKLSREIETRALDAALRIIPRKACEAGEYRFLRVLASCLPGVMPGDMKHANRVAAHLGLSTWKTLVEDPASIEKLRASLLLVLIGDLETAFGARKRLEAVAELLKVDFDELRKKAKAEIEAPKQGKGARRG